MILDASGREARVTTDHHPADVAALCFLLNALLHGPGCGVAYSKTMSGHEIHGPFFAVRATRHGVQQRTA